MKLQSLVARSLLAAAVAGLTGNALAAPTTYQIDPNHTYPSFAADHFGGLSVWRGKFDRSSGTVTYDKEAQSGSVEVKVDVASIDFGHDKLNEHAKSDEIFDAAKYPTATYQGKLAGFKNGAPTEIDGTLELHGVTKPLKLKIEHFLCKPNPMTKQETCGAEASASLNRDDFGVSYGKSYGFDMGVKLQIQIEAIRQ